MNTADLEALLVNVGVDPTLVKPGPYVPELPDRIVLATVRPGSGLMNEGVVDQINFQVRARGAQNDQGDAEALARDVDIRLIREGGGQQAGDTWVYSVGRAGGAPALDPSEPDDGRRYNLTCTYTLMVGTDI